MAADLYFGKPKITIRHHISTFTACIGTLIKFYSERERLHASNLCGKISKTASAFGRLYASSIIKKLSAFPEQNLKKKIRKQAID